VHRDVVRDSAVSKLHQAAALAAANSFTTDEAWANGVVYTNLDIEKIAYSMAAMTLAWYPRDATEAATVDWAAVETDAAKGMSTGTPVDWHAQGDGGVSWANEFMGWFEAIDTGHLNQRVAHFLDPDNNIDPYRIGYDPAQPNSPDARMGDGSFGNSETADNFTTIPLTANGGSDFSYEQFGEWMRPDRGFYAQGNIGHVRFDASRTQASNDVYFQYGELPGLGYHLNDLVWAEALIRQGGAANLIAAAALIDGTRVGRGGLSSAAGYIANVGAPTDGPCMANNVLAKDGTACTLWSVLLYENEIETLGFGPAPYWNQRHLPNVAATNWEQSLPGAICNGATPPCIWNGARWIQGLLTGTPREMPVPYKELGVKGEALYTWGGLNPANSAP